MKKTQEEIDNMGWNLEDTDAHYTLDQMFDTLSEIKSCRRGCLTNCHTYAELSKHLKDLSKEMIAVAESLKYMKDDNGEND